MHSLPNELILAIGAYLQQNSVYKLALTCKRLSHLLQHLLYISPTFKNDIQLHSFVNSSNLSQHGCRTKKFSCLVPNRWKLVNDTLILSLSKYCSNLVYLDLRNCGNVHDYSLLELFTRNIYLETVILSHCVKVSDTSISILCMNSPKLKTLYLENCNISNETIQTLSTFCHKLQDLSISFCNHITSVSSLSQCTLLKNLQLDYTCIDDESILALACECKSLAFISIASCHHLTPNSILALANYSCNLQSLNLYDLYGISEDCTALLFRKCPLLHEVVLSKKTLARQLYEE